MKKIIYPQPIIVRFMAAGLLCRVLTSALATEGNAVAVPATTVTGGTNAAAPDETEIIREYSYMLGRMKAHELTSYDIYVQPSAYRAGLVDALQRKPSKFPDQVMNEHLAAMQARLDRRSEQQLEEYRQRGVVMLEKNAKAEGVITTSSGLQYKVVKAGDGKLFKDGNVVLMNYIFEDNYGQRMPLSSVADPSQLKFQVGATTIEGLDEALRLMSPGAIFDIKIPPALAFGERQKSSISPYTVMSLKLTALSLVREMGDQRMNVTGSSHPTFNPNKK